MGLKRFDRKFGADLVRELPTSPGVYLFKDERGEVLYAGKAKNIRRRLQGYRNASRRKVHRKMRTLVRVAHSLEVRLQESERDALLLENELIRTLRPRYNDEGTWTFLYPAIGMASRGGSTLVGFTTRPEAWSDLELHWFGTFRSRLRPRDGFDALVALLERVGHLEPSARLPAHRRTRGSRLVAFRRLDAPLRRDLRAFLAGESTELLERLCERLLEQRSARREAASVEESLRELDAFYRDDLAPLRGVLRAAGRDGHFVPRAERDALFIAARYGR